MNSAVVYYSNTNQSKRIAGYFADKLDYPIYDIYDVEQTSFDSLVLVFPVHCQSTPDKVKDFLGSVQTQNLTLIATYGRMCYGNAIYEIQQGYNHNIVAAAYIPTRHSYLQDSQFDGFESLQPIIRKVLNPSAVKIPKSYKNPLSSFIKSKRSQMGVKIKKTDKCNACGVCSQICKLSAITDGVTNSNCIRCLKCVSLCPQNALEFSLTLPMRAYLKKKKQDKLIIYI